MIGSNHVHAGARSASVDGYVDCRFRVTNNLQGELMSSKITRASRFTPMALASLLACGAVTTQAADVKVQGADAAFMKQAAENGHAEVESSKLALSKSTNAGVKIFARQMVDDHTKAGDELNTLAQNKGVTVSAEPSVAQRAKIKMMQTLDGASFDRRYASTFGVTAHEDTIKLFRKEAQNGKDADLKAWATKTLPTLEHHLSMSKELKSKAGAEKSSNAASNRPQ
jgi:putative membrane protein